MCPLVQRIPAPAWRNRQMTATQPAVFPVHLSKPPMDDRKRSLADADDLAPSRKRIVKDEAGQLMRLDADKEKDVEVCETENARHSRSTYILQNYQKDAIIRQMKEYKREKKYYEDLSNELSRKVTIHDDHLRALDAWFAQLLDELRVLAGEQLSSTSDMLDGESIATTIIYMLRVV